MKILVTGAAGFIGHYVAHALLARGDSVVGIDNLNSYYDVALKKARLCRIAKNKNFQFICTNIADSNSMLKLVEEHPQIECIVHLAAQAGVRYSLDNPFAYIEANIMGQMVVLELCRALKDLKHFVYASSSSVYGGNTKVPFAVEDKTDTPISLYAATKRADELMGHCYSHLFKVPSTGLRFFTVYGPWGRPDMAAYLFTKAMFAGKHINVFNHGDMERDFTYIDDIVAGVLSCLDNPPANQKDKAPHVVYNIGNSSPEPLMRFIEILEYSTGCKAEINFQPMQPGDVKSTFADISPIQRAFGFEPKTPIDVGLPKFVAWFRDYHGV